jgi:hypothetical protein
VPLWTGYGIFNAAVATACTGLIIWSILRDGRKLARPAYIVALLAHLIFQWPLAVFSSTIARGLTEHWFFALAVHCSVLVGLSWVWLTPQLAVRPAAGEAPSMGQPQVSRINQVLVLVLYATLTAVVLLEIGWRCTGLYAMLTDAELALLAREISGKLTKSALANYSFGVLVNVVCPIVVYFAMRQTSLARTAGALAKSIVWIAIGASAFFIVVLTGAKGNLLPTILVVTVGMLALRASLWQRGLTIAVALLTGLALLSAVEVLRERNTRWTHGYNFAACAVRLGACPEAKTLLASLKARDMSLGVPRARVERLSLELEVACSRGTPLGPLAPGALIADSIREQERADEQAGKESNAIGEDGLGASGEGRGLAARIERMREYAVSILYRIYVVPLQVATWHFEYALDFGTPGMKALPGAALLFGERIVMPIRVHEAYYHLYAGGDRTSTGTAPTSFLLAYPAYLGWAGVLLAAFALIVFDGIASMIIRRLRGLTWAGIGLIAGFSMNFLTSDFGTTLLSHGAFAGLLLMLLLARFEARKPSGDRS